MNEQECRESIENSPAGRQRTQRQVPRERPLIANASSSPDSTCGKLTVQLGNQIAAVYRRTQFLRMLVQYAPLPVRIAGTVLRSNARSSARLWLLM